MSNDTIDMDPTSIIINNSTRLDRSAATNFHSLRGRGVSYSLEALLFLYQNRSLKYPEYTAACIKHKITKVFQLDRKDVIAYLSGEVDTCAALSSKKADLSTRSLENTLTQSGSKSAVVSSKVSHAPLRSNEKEPSFSDNRKLERDQRSMDSILMVREVEFSALRDKLFRYLNDSKARNEGNASQKQAYDPRGDRYSNNQDRFWRENMGTDFQTLGIDMSGSFKKPAVSKANGSSEKRERDRISSGRLSSSDSAKRTKVDPQDLIPIIIVPTGFANLICHGNMRTFLEDGRFVTHEEMRKSKVAQISKVIQESAFRVPGGNCSQAEYHLVYNPSRLSSSAWNRVIAVVCSGQEWQFKKFPIYNNDLHAFFRKVQGFYFHYDDRQPSQNANSWPIKKLAFSRQHRYTDAQVLVEFWNTLDKFVSSKGKHLRY